MYIGISCYAKEESFFYISYGIRGTLYNFCVKIQSLQDYICNTWTFYHYWMVVTGASCTEVP